VTGAQRGAINERVITMSTPNDLRISGSDASFLSMKGALAQGCRNELVVAFGGTKIGKSDAKSISA
jgi:hypothetical protein